MSEIDEAKVEARAKGILRRIEKLVRNAGGYIVSFAPEWADETLRRRFFLYAKDDSKGLSFHLRWRGRTWFLSPPDNLPGIYGVNRILETLEYLFYGYQWSIRVRRERRS